MNKLDAERQSCTTDVISRLDSLIRDELGYLRRAQTGGQLPSDLVSELYECTSINLITDLAFRE